jgi:predicted O-linked N-acetylglucosamine transferase (SPINDLY family)
MSLSAGTQQSAPALHILAHAALDAGNVEAALDLARRTVGADPDCADYHATLGRALKAAGRSEEALAAYRQAVRLRPSFARYHVGLGMTLRVCGRKEEAMAAYRRACALEPDMAEAHHNLGNLLAASGDLEAARACYLRVLALSPNFAEAHFELGNLDHVSGDAAGAVAHYRRALDARPRHARSWLALGRILFARGETHEAIACFEKSAEAAPELFDAHFHLGLALRRGAERERAILAYRRALAIDSTHPRALVDLAMLLRESAQREEAVACCRRAIELQPDFADAHLALGMLCYDLEEHAQTLAAYEKSLELQPDSAVTHLNLSSAYKRVALIDKALSHARRAIELDSALHQAHNNLGTLLMELGECDAAEASYRRAIELRPDYAEAQANWCATLSYVDADDCSRIHAAHLEYGVRHAARLAPVEPHPRARSEPRCKLRIGYVSPDFKRHSVAYFIEPLLASHDRGEFEILGYYSNHVGDETSLRLRSYCDEWIESPPNIVSDEALARRVREDGVDILVDLAGHTAGARLLAFARKPAPVQITYLGYLTTTGVAAIDYRLTDTLVDPEGYEAHAVERPLRVPGCYLCYRPAPESPEPGRPPALDNGYITFGSFNNVLKIGTTCAALWARVLLAVPGSKLLLKTRSLGDAAVRATVTERFAAHGIEAERLIVLPGDAETRAHLTQYHRVDIALDTFPYNGVTTTCEALWMGVPVVSRVGPTHAARQGLTLLNAVGMPELAARSAEHYLQVCVLLARDVERLARIRAELRGRMAGSGLMQEAAFARRVEETYRGAWRARSAAGANA